MAVAWYLKDQVKSDQVFNNLTDLALCNIKSWMTVDKPSTAEVDQWLNHSMGEAQLSPMMKNH